MPNYFVQIRNTTSLFIALNLGLPNTTVGLLPGASVSIPITCSGICPGRVNIFDPCVVSSNQIFIADTQIVISGSCPGLKIFISNPFVVPRVKGLNLVGASVRVSGSGKC